MQVKPFQIPDPKKATLWFNLIGPLFYFIATIYVFKDHSRDLSTRDQVPYIKVGFLHTLW